MAPRDRNNEKSSKVEQKRSHPSLMEFSGSELLSNKKQALQCHNRPDFGVPQMNLFSWNNAPSLHSIPGLFSDRAFGNIPPQEIHLFDRNIPLLASQNVDMGGKSPGEHYGNNPSAGMSLSHTVEGSSPFPTFGGYHLKLNQSHVAGHSMPETMAHSYDSASRLLASDPIYSNGCISLSQACSVSGKNDALLGQDIGKGFCDFVSMNQGFNKEQRSFQSMSGMYSKENENFLSMGQPFREGNDILSYSKENSSIISTGAFYNSQGNENFVAVAAATDKAIGNQVLSSGEASVISIAPLHEKLDNSFGSGESNMISFGGFHDETRMNQTGNIIGSYNGTVNATQCAEQVGSSDLIDRNVDPNPNFVSNANNTKIDVMPKTKEPKMTKKASPNTFPSNVKSLLSTGMFDGITVKYYSWSREKNLKGVIRGTGYLCGCKECNFTKVLNAYEFERHASCKTKHPNNHIYFESGKTVYAVVQELKNTPQEMLFDAIQNVTGSEINQKNFITWKTSYQAAARELQRIYGKDEFSASS